MEAWPLHAQALAHRRRAPCLPTRSERDPREPNPEFVWNSWLRQPLVELGLYDHCPALLQARRRKTCRVLPAQGGGAICSVLPFEGTCCASMCGGGCNVTRYAARCCGPAPACLLQGAVECSTLALPGAARFSMCLISRRSRRHPGTRYIGALSAAACRDIFGSQPVQMAA